MYGSTIGSHAIGSPFMLLDDAVEAWDYDVGLIGKTVHFKFTSFNRSGLVEENIEDVTDDPFSITGACIGLLTPAHSSYRSLTNPLTAHDAGSSATINVAAFSMRVPGQADIAFSSGTVTGISYKTLCYVFVSDTGFLPLSAPVYLMSTTKEAAIDAAGYMFVGSILTPSSGGADMYGNNDGSGAQVEQTTVIAFTAAATGTIVGTGTVSSPSNLIDGDSTTVATLTATANGVVGGGLAEINTSGPASVLQAISQLYVAATLSVPTNNPVGDDSSVAVQLAVSTDGGASFGSEYVLFPAGSTFTPNRTQAIQTVLLPVIFQWPGHRPAQINLKNVQARVAAGTDAVQTSGSISLQVNQVSLVATQ